jgi:DNA topoisomerase-1
MSKLVIVESPAKCSKIAGYLGDGWNVMASMGHIRGLDESLEALKIGTWDPTYVDLPAKKETISKLKAAARKAAEVWIATDDDREGEGIAWHVCTVLGLPVATTKRIVFHEITKTAILAAAAAPTTINLPKFYSQQTRSMLDMLIGFTISKVLWTRVPSAKSAGRCQTPALRLVLDRDQEVESHTATSSWQLQGTFEPQTQPAVPLPSLEGTAKEALPTRDTSLAVLTKVHTNRNVLIKDVTEKVSISNAPRPLITSTLQQEASSLYGFSPKQTMSAAQKLYEGGYITYMRTDHAVLSREAILALRHQIKTRFGEEYQGAFGQSMGGGAPGAQAAHEAIRPTHAEHQTVEADSVGSRIYQLIWRRAMQSQMAPCKTDVRTYTLQFEAEPDRVWIVEQSKIQFAGWKMLEPTNHDVKDSVEWTAWNAFAKVGTKLVWTTLAGHERFTKPAPRYTEASLVRDLERKGIGRPSTFASLIATLQEREYVEKTNLEGKEQETHHLLINTPSTWPPKEEVIKHTVGAEKNKLRVTPIGRSAIEFLAKEFNDLFSYDYTAKMETDLDRIASGEKEWKSLLQESWDSYKTRYESFTGKEARAANKASLSRILSPTVQVAHTHKGPLIVRPPPEGSPKEVKPMYAPSPTGTTFETLTLAQAEAALEAAKQAKEGIQLGMWEGSPILKKKGPYGLYVSWTKDDVKLQVPIKAGDSLEAIQAKLLAKRSDETCKIGDYTIKNGPFGYYCFNHTLKKAIFVKWPPDTDFKTATAEQVSTIYSAGVAAKRSGGWKGKRGGKK